MMVEFKCEWRDLLVAMNAAIDGIEHGADVDDAERVVSWISAVQDDPSGPYLLTRETAIAFARFAVCGYRYSVSDILSGGGISEGLSDDARDEAVRRLASVMPTLRRIARHDV